jgi:hypothetical protein
MINASLGNVQRNMLEESVKRRRATLASDPIKE